MKHLTYRYSADYTLGGNPEKLYRVENIHMFPSNKTRKIKSVNL